MALEEIAGCASWLGPHRDLVLPRGAGGRLGAGTGLVARAHAAGLAVGVFTMRDENHFLAADFRRGGDPAAHGDGAAQVTAFLDEGVDAVFSDVPDTALAARDAWLARTARGHLPDI